MFVPAAAWTMRAGAGGDGSDGSDGSGSGSGTYDAAHITPLDKGAASATESARARYALTVSVAPSLARNVGKQVTSEMRKQANFPGFRKGAIPPFMQSTVTGFAIRECIQTTLRDVASDNGYALLGADIWGDETGGGSSGGGGGDDDDTEVDVRTDLDALRKTLKLGDGFRYEAHVTLEPQSGGGGAEGASGAGATSE